VESWRGQLHVHQVQPLDHSWPSDITPFENLVTLTPSKTEENNHNLLRSGCPQIYLNLIDIEIVAISNATKGQNNSRSSTHLKFGGVYAEEVDLAVLASWMQLLEKFFAVQIIKYVGGAQYFAC